MTSVKFTRHVMPTVTLALVLGLAVPVTAQTTPPAGSGVPATPAPGAIAVAPATSGKTTATSGSGVMSNAATAPATKPTAVTSTTTVKMPGSDEFKTVALATAHCPGDTVVWSTLSRSKSYHLSTSKYYGKTKHGAYVCEKDATTYGFHASKE